MAAKKKITLNRRDVVSRIIRDRGRVLIVTGLGSTTWDAAAAGDHPNNFYLWGGMGGAAVTGLGLARAQPGRRVIVLTGDGEMLMGIGSLATIGVAAPPNLAICVIDNQRYGETGMQETHTGHGVDLAAMAAGAGFAHTETVWTKRCGVSDPASLRDRGSGLCRYQGQHRLRADGAADARRYAIRSRFREAVLVTGIRLNKSIK